MVTRAVIHKIISDEEVVVKVPAYDLIEEEEDEEEVDSLPTARISTMPGCTPNYKVGDSVFICIEDNDLNQPTVMGMLIPDKCDEDKIGTSDAIFSSLKVKVNVVLCEDTTIGEVIKDEIKCLTKVRMNIQSQFDTNMSQKTEMLNYLSKQLSSATNNINQI